MPPILAPLTNSIVLSITTFIIALFGYHLILKIFTLREAANNLKLLSEAVKNCDSGGNENLGVKAAITAEIQGVIEKTRASFDFETHYAELFRHISKAVSYAFLMCIFALAGIVLGLLLTIGLPQGSLSQHQVVVIRWAFCGVLILIGFMLWLLRDMPNRNPQLIWIGLVFVGGLVIGASILRQEIKPGDVPQKTVKGTPASTQLGTQPAPAQSPAK